MTVVTSEGSDSELTRAAGGGERQGMITTVDDDSGFAGYLRTFLELRGYKARAYTRGDEILAAIRHGEPLDAVLLDVAMPGMNGLETLKALEGRASRERIPIPPVLGGCSPHCRNRLATCATTERRINTN